MWIIATFTAISEKTQPATAMKRVLDYVMQDKKTVIDSIKLVSGQNCVPESSYQEFMQPSFDTVKRQVCSSNSMCNPLNRIAVLRRSRYTKSDWKRQKPLTDSRLLWQRTLTATTGINCETEYKIQINEKDLEELWQRSDEICQQFGLQVLQPYQKPKQRSLNQREYRAALRGNSKKLKISNAIDYAVAMSRNKKQFIEQLQKLGYGVKWIDHDKYITYTTPDGQRFRDNRLLDDKYLKTNMEELFAYEYGAVKTDQSNTNDNRADGRRFDRTDTADILDVETRTVQSVGTAHFTDWKRHCAKDGFDIRVANASGFEQSNGADAQTVFSRDAKDNGRQAGLNRVFHQGQIIEADGILERATTQGEIKRMMNELKAKDLTPWKLKLKWAAVGAILPSIACILQLILR